MKILLKNISELDYLDGSESDGYHYKGNFFINKDMIRYFGTIIEVQPLIEGGRHRHDYNNGYRWVQELTDDHWVYHDDWIKEEPVDNFIDKDEFTL